MRVCLNLYLPVLFSVQALVTCFWWSRFAEVEKDSPSKRLLPSGRYLCPKKSTDLNLVSRFRSKTFKRSIFSPTATETDQNRTFFGKKTSLPNFFSETIRCQNFFSVPLKLELELKCIFEIWVSGVQSGSPFWSPTRRWGWQWGWSSAFSASDFFLILYLKLLTRAPPIKRDSIAKDNISPGLNHGSRVIVDVLIDSALPWTSGQSEY